MKSHSLLPAAVALPIISAAQSTSNACPAPLTTYVYEYEVAYSTVVTTPGTIFNILGGTNSIVIINPPQTIITSGTVTTTVTTTATVSDGSSATSVPAGSTPALGAGIPAGTVSTIPSSSPFVIAVQPVTNSRRSLVRRQSDPSGDSSVEYAGGDGSSTGANQANTYFMQDGQLVGTYGGMVGLTLPNEYTSLNPVDNPDVSTTFTFVDGLLGWTVDTASVGGKKKRQDSISATFYLCPNEGLFASFAGAPYDDCAQVVAGGISVQTLADAGLIDPSTVPGYDPSAESPPTSTDGSAPSTTSGSANSSMPTAAVCPDDDGKAVNGYTITCFQGLASSDIKNPTMEPDLQACLDLCDGTNGCLSLTFGSASDGLCYLHSEQYPAYNDTTGNYDSAEFHDGSSSSSSSSSSSAATTTATSISMSSSISSFSSTTPESTISDILTTNTPTTESSSLSLMSSPSGVASTSSTLSSTLNSSSFTSSVSNSVTSSISSTSAMQTSSSPSISASNLPSNTSAVSVGTTSTSSASAANPTTSGSLCAKYNNTVTPGNPSYQIECNHNVYFNAAGGGNNYYPNGNTTATFEACVQLCSSLQGCTGANFFAPASACYTYKGPIYFGDYSADNYGAIVVGGGSSITPVSSPTSTSAPAVTSATSPAPSGSVVTVPSPFTAVNSSSSVIIANSTAGSTSANILSASAVNTTTLTPAANTNIVSTTSVTPGSTPTVTATQPGISNSTTGGDGNAGTIGSSGTSSSSSTTSSSGGASTASAAPQNSFCGNDNPVPVNATEYDDMHIECGYTQDSDPSIAGGGNLNSNSPTTFEDCVYQCHTNTMCAGLSWQNATAPVATTTSGNCYLHGASNKSPALNPGWAGAWKTGFTPDSTR